MAVIGEAGVYQSLGIVDDSHKGNGVQAKMGPDQQERFMAAHRRELQTGLMIGLGGSLDGFAGVVKRAPQWMIRCNLEWLYRLMKEPSRLGRMMRLPKFVRACKKQRQLEEKEGGAHG